MSIRLAVDQKELKRRVEELEKKVAELEAIVADLKPKPVTRKKVNAV